MEQLSRTPEQQAKWERAEEIRNNIAKGEVTDISILDPRETSIEFVQEAKKSIRALRALGARAL